MSAKRYRTLHADFFTVETERCDFASILGTVNGMSGKARNFVTNSGDPIRLKKMSIRSEGRRRFFAGDMVKIRMTNLPTRIDQRGSEREIDFHDDEGIGEETAFFFDYTNDEIGRRIARVDSGEAFAETAFERYSYNDRSEVIGSQRFYGADIDDLSRPVTGRTFGYGYDPIAISRSLATRRRKAAHPPASVPEPPLGQKKWPSDEFLTIDSPFCA